MSNHPMCLTPPTSLNRTSSFGDIGSLDLAFWHKVWPLIFRPRYRGTQWVDFDTTHWKANLIRIPNLSLFPLLMQDKLC